MGYKKPYTYRLTPSRKHLGKAVARGSRYAIADECLSQPLTQKYVLKKIGVLVGKELRNMCSDSTRSVLKSQDTSDLCEFTWHQVICELDKNAPIFLNLMNSMTYTTTQRANRSAVIGICAGILLKHRFSNMCLLQKLLSLILYAGHCGKQVL